MGTPPEDGGGPTEERLAAARAAAVADMAWGRESQKRREGGAVGSGQGSSSGRHGLGSVVGGELGVGERKRETEREREGQ